MCFWIIFFFQNAGSQLCFRFVFICGWDWVFIIKIESSKHTSVAHGSIAVFRLVRRAGRSVHNPKTKAGLGAGDRWLAKPGLEPATFRSWTQCLNWPLILDLSISINLSVLTTQCWRLSLGLSNLIFQSWLLNLDSSVLTDLSVLTSLSWPLCLDFSVLTFQSLDRSLLTSQSWPLSLDPSVLTDLSVLTYVFWLLSLDLSVLTSVSWLLSHDFSVVATQSWLLSLDLSVLATQSWLLTLDHSISTSQSWPYIYATSLRSFGPGPRPTPFRISNSRTDCSCRHAELISHATPFPVFTFKWRHGTSLGLLRGFMVCETTQSLCKENGLEE